MADTELCFHSIEELAPRLGSGEVSPVDVVEALLARIEQYNASLIAYLHVDVDRARAAARAAEIEISAGGYRGPLHGIPVAYKDIFHVQHLPTTAGSRLMADYVAPEDCTVASRLRQAGAICIGKLNTIEFASGSLISALVILSYTSDALRLFRGLFSLFVRRFGFLFVDGQRLHRCDAVIRIGDGGNAFR